MNAAEPLPLLERPITSFPSKEKTTGTRQTLRWFVDKLMGDDFRDQIETIRAADPVTAKTLKGKLPAVVFGGYYPSRKAGAAPVELSKLLSLDFDKLGEDDARGLKERIALDPHVVLAFISPGGQGVKAVIRCDGAASHADAFSTAASYFEKKFNVKCDPACKDAGRLCFFSWDDDAVVNERAAALAVVTSANVRASCAESGDRHDSLSYLSAAPAPAPAPATVSCISTPVFYNVEQDASNPVEMLRAENAARIRLAELKAAGEKGLAWCYEKLILQRHPARRGKRNEWLTEATPFLFRALSGPVAARVVEICYDLNVGIWNDPKEQHLASFGKLWSGCESSYPSELNAGELAYYVEIDGPDKAAFRICRDLAVKKEGLFFMGCDKLRYRTAGDGGPILNRLKAHGVIALVTPGQRRKAGIYPKAATFRWLLGERKEAAA